MTDSYQFQIEPEPRVEVPKFRVGGVYRDGAGVVQRVLSALDGGDIEVISLERWQGGQRTDGFRHTSTGRFDVCADDESAYHLIPGELIQRDGQWVAADSIGPFPSGATLTTSGDKIVGRVESMTPTLDKLEASKDPQRAPLPHFNQRTPHDTFGDGFIVTKGAVETPTTTSPTTDSAYPAIAGLLRG